MSLPKPIKNRLIDLELLPKSASGLNTFEDLSGALIRKNKNKELFVSFLIDSDPTQDTYLHLLKKFIAASKKKESLPEFELTYDENSYRYSILDKSSESEKKISWIQETSYISTEFIDFCASLMNDKEMKLLLLPSGEAETFIYIQKEIAQEILEWHASPDTKRWEFWGNIRHWQEYLESEHPILPASKYDEVLGKFSDNFLNDNGSVIDPVTYRIAAIRLPYVYSGYFEDFLDSFSGSIPDGFDEYLESDDQFHPGIDEWLPDELCYVLLLDCPDEKIIYEATPKDAEKIRGENKFSNYLYIDKGFNWSIAVVSADLRESKFMLEPKWHIHEVLVLAGDLLIDRVQEKIRRLKS